MAVSFPASPRSDHAPLDLDGSRWRFWPALTTKRFRSTRAARAYFDPARPLAFMHVPKSGGTSLRVALRETLTPCHAIGGFDRMMFGDFEDFPTLGEALRREVHLSVDCLPPSNLIAGHLAYSSLRQRYPNAQFVTVLREPLSRILSHWLFWRGYPDELLAPWGSWADRVRLARRPLAAFLDSRPVACQLDNIVVRMLLWPHPLIPVDDFIDPRHDQRLLAEASERLASFDIVDVLENPKLSTRFRRWFRRGFALPRSNETNAIPEPLRQQLATELSAEAFELLAARSRLDLELWSSAARRCLPGRDPALIRQQAIRRNLARYAKLMWVH